MLSVAIFCVLVLVKFSDAAVNSQQYCATINSDEAAGASYVALQILDGVATYSFSLDLNNFENTTACAYSTYGLKFHIHSYWNDNSNTSAANSYCGATYSGGHYDPTLACSQSSQYHTSLCPEINRTSPSYTYSCSPTNYAEGRYDLCEIGDTSSKSGVVYPESGQNLQFSLTNFVDYQAPYTYNYLTSDTNAIMWASYVFHCAQNDNRLVCAKFSETDTAACSAAFDDFPSTESSSSSSSDKKYTSTDLALGIVLPAVGMLLVGAFIGYCVFRGKESILNGKRGGGDDRV